MSLKFKSSSIRIFCALFFFLSVVCCFGQTVLHAQVPGQNHGLAFASGASTITERTGSEVSEHPGTSVGKSISSSTLIPFGSGPNQILDMKGYDQEFTRSFSFKNTSTETYTINSIDFEKQDNKFDVSAIDAGLSLPFDVAPGQTFSIHIAFHAFERNTSCSNRLVFITEQSNQPVIYPIQALQQPLSDMPWNKKAVTSNIN